MSRAVTVICALAALACPATANASLTLVIPPSNSGADQYVESIPTAGGGRPTISVTRSGGQATRPLSPSTQTALAAQGPDGVQAAALVRATAPASVRVPISHRRPRRSVTPQGASPSSGSGGSGGASPGAGSSGSGAAGSVLSALTGSGASGGMGAGLLVALIAAPLVLASIGLTRRRRAS